MVSRGFFRGISGHGSIVFGSPALSLVLEPDLDGAWGHSQLEGQVEADLRRREEGFFEHLVEFVYLVCGRAFPFWLHHPALLHGRWGRLGIGAAGKRRGWLVVASVWRRRRGRRCACVYIAHCRGRRRRWWWRWWWALLIEGRGRRMGRIHRWRRRRRRIVAVLLLLLLLGDGNGDGRRRRGRRRRRRNGLGSVCKAVEVVLVRVLVGRGGRGRLVDGAAEQRMHRRELDVLGRDGRRIIH